MCMITVANAPASLLQRLFGGRSGARSLHVSGTSIYARREGSRQIVVYSMNLRSPGEAAMILPLPVRPGLPEEDAHQFVALDGAPTLFDDLLQLFAQTQFLGQSKGGGPLRRQAPRPRLAVKTVGSFDASFVPSIADFDRLDPRFRLPSTVWSELPGYGDYGFAVFKLRPGNALVHPMALWFETRSADQLFFPTVHVHDGSVHAEAAFDHRLYWETPGPVGQLADGVAPEPSRGLQVPPWLKARANGVFGDGYVQLRVLRGTHPNRDQWQPAASR